MAIGRDQGEWLRVQVMIQRIAGCWTKEPIPAYAVNPYVKQRKSTFEENNRRMAAHQDRMDRQAMGK